jgi:hypothetical protein
LGESRRKFSASVFNKFQQRLDYLSASLGYEFSPQIDKPSILSQVLTTLEQYDWVLQAHLDL